jgi:hypothetical protein
MMITSPNTANVGILSLQTVFIWISLDAVESPNEVEGRIPDSGLEAQLGKEGVSWSKF